MRKLGKITDDLEELLYEMVDDHEMQAYEVIHLIYGWIQAHYPDAIENYKYGGSPVLYYGHKSKLKRKKA